MGIEDVILTFDPLTLNILQCIGCDMMKLYQILVKSNNPQLSYSDKH